MANDLYYTVSQTALKGSCQRCGKADKLIGFTITSPQAVRKCALCYDCAKLLTDGMKSRGVKFKPSPGPIAKEAVAREAVAREAAAREAAAREAAAREAAAREAAAREAAARGAAAREAAAQEAAAREAAARRAAAREIETFADFRPTESPVPISARREPIAAGAAENAGRPRRLSPFKIVLQLVLIVAVFAAGLLLHDPLLGSSRSSRDTDDAEEAGHTVQTFAIEGKWKNVGETSFGQMQTGSVVTFNGTNCNVYSPADTYGLEKEGSRYRLTCTNFLWGDSVEFIVTVQDNDNILLDYYGHGETVVQLQRID